MDARISSPPLPPQAVYSHSRITLTCRPSKPLFVAGQHLDGILEVACSSDKLWLGNIAIELRGAEQLHSRDHAASQAFLQADAAFQSTSLPPSNAVVATAPSSSGHWPARKGVTRFPFSFAIPASCPSSCKFGGNASVTYTLLATCQVQFERERQILTRRLDVDVVESWSDWQHVRFKEPSQAQIRQQVQTSLGISGLGKTEGSVSVEAMAQDPLRFQGWREADGALEVERARGEINIELFVNNRSARTISGIKVSLLRRLKILPSTDTPTDKTLVISAASAPMITDTIDEITLRGSEWDFPPSDQFKRVACTIPVPTPERFLTVRKTTLFEIHTLVRLNLEMGALSKDITLELPMWTAHWASMPQAIFHPRSNDLQSQYTRPATSQGLYRSQSARPLSPADIGMHNPHSRAPPLHSPVFSPTSPQPGRYTQSRWDHLPDGNASAYGTLPQPRPTFVPFDPHAAQITQSRFAGQRAPWHGQPISDMAPSPAPAYVMLSSSAPASRAGGFAYWQGVENTGSVSQWQPTAPENFVRSWSAGPTTSHAAATSVPTRELPQAIRARLTPDEQARVLANASPAVYDVVERARGLDQGNAHSTGSPSLTGRQRRQSMPTSIETLQRSSSADGIRPLRTPPLAPSSRFAVQQPPSESPDQADNGLETIGEDGESQAGTIRLPKGPIARSTSQEHIRSLKAVKAVNTAVDEEGNTSVSLLEDIAERKDRETEAKNKMHESHSPQNILAQLHESSPNKDKTLPKATTPVAAKSPPNSSAARPHVSDIFRITEAVKTAVSSPKVQQPDLPGASRRVVSGPSSNVPKTTSQMARPAMKHSRSDTLLALESRLLRPASPSMPAEPFSSPPVPTVSPPPRSATVSPIQRAISPVHTGNAGALRKRSSQLSIRTRTKQATAELEEHRPVKSQTSTTIARPSADGKVVRPQSQSPESEEARKSVPEKSPEAVNKAVTDRTTARMTPVTDQKVTIVTAYTQAISKQLASTQATQAQVPSSKKTLPAISPPVAKPKVVKALEKRHVSDPQTKLQDQNAKQTDPSRSLDTTRPRRSSFNALSQSDKYGSARGGRGGIVSSVANQWAELIAQETGKTPADVKSTALRPPHGNLSKASTTSAKQAQAPLPSKSSAAISIVNATIGKAPVFVRPVKKVETPTMTTPEDGRGPGAARLRDLIRKYS